MAFQGLPWPSMAFHGLARPSTTCVALKAVFPYEPPCYDTPRDTCRGAGELCYWEPLCSTPWFDPYGGYGCNEQRNRQLLGQF